jgi:hypothetical protein
MIKASPEQYIYPPRSKDAIPRSDTNIFATLRWRAQYKYNDTRLLVKICPNGQIQLWNRHAERYRTYHLPEHLQQQLEHVATQLGHIPGHLTLLDGGLLDQKHRAIKDTIVIWDILVLNDQHLIGTTYSQRHNQILSISSVETWDYHHDSSTSIPFGQKLSEDIFTPNNIPPEHWQQAWNTIEKVNEPFTIGKPNQPGYQCSPVLEGLVFKDPHGLLEMGFKQQNNDSWMIRSRVKTGRHTF